jgi:aconitate hydratase
MGMNVVEKILRAHLVEGEYVEGQEIGIRIDQTLTQDATGTMAYLQFEAMGIPRVQTELSVSYIDHNTVQVGFENADDHRYLMSIAKKIGVQLSRPGNGICHQLHLERFGVPGKTLLGSDSHTPTGGGLGMIAMGAGGLDVAVAMGGGAFSITAPRVVKVNLTGELQDWVAAKDVILKVLEKYGVKGNVGRVMEYGGPGAATLSVPQRATITNMGAELGVTTSVFPSDDTTRAFLKAQDREGDWVELLPDADAEYEEIFDVDMSTLQPMFAAPHSPGNIVTVESLEGTPVDQVAIGSCTNSSYADLKMAANAVEGRKLPEATVLGIGAGSRQVVEMLAEDGGYLNLVKFGARFWENACGFCIGNHGSPKTDAFAVRTSNRNFFGRSGTKSANVYLASPETAIACAITGVVTDPRKLGMPYPKVETPSEFMIDDSMILAPADAAAADAIEIVRGPNIGEPPRANPVPETLAGVVTIKVEDKITTDHIIPAGARMKYRSNVPKYSEYVFEIVDDQFHVRAGANRDNGVHNVIVAGESYGQGSSREHAAICPAYLGVKAVLAKGLERIHTANLINFGVVPLIFDDMADYDGIEQGDALEIPGLHAAVTSGAAQVTVNNTTKGTSFQVNLDLSERARLLLGAGGRLPYTKQQMG